MLVENHEVVGFGEKSVVFCEFWVSEEIVKNQLARAQLRYEEKQASLPRPRDREDRQGSGHGTCLAEISPKAGGQVSRQAANPVWRGEPHRSSTSPPKPEH